LVSYIDSILHKITHRRNIVLCVIYLYLLFMFLKVLCVPHKSLWVVYASCMSWENVNCVNVCTTLNFHKLFNYFYNYCFMQFKDIIRVFGMGSSRAPSVCFPVSLFYIPGLHLKFMLPSNTHISDWDLISHDPFIHDPLLMNTNDPFLIFTFPFSITVSNFYTNSFFDYIHREPNKNWFKFWKGLPALSWARGYMDYETANEKYSGPSPNPNNKAKPMTFESGIGLMSFQFQF